MPSGSPGEAPCGGHAQRHQYPEAVIHKLLTFIYNCTVHWHIRIHARRLARTQIRSQSDALALRFTRAQSPHVLRSIVSVRVVYHAIHFGTPLARFVAPRITTEEGNHNCGTHTCIWLGPSSG
eukprot:8142150-Pyramimonas_sp.AAC.1